MRLALGAAVLAPLLLTHAARSEDAGPRTVAYVAGTPVPAGHHVEMTSSRAMRIAGGFTFFLTYLPCAYVAAKRADAKSLLVPVAGPILWASDTRDPATPYLILAGSLVSAAQATGIYLFIAGFKRRPVVVPDIEAAPLISRDMSGLVVSGRF